MYTNFDVDYLVTMILITLIITTNIWILFASCRDQNAAKSLLNNNVNPQNTSGILRKYDDVIASTDLLKVQWVSIIRHYRRIWRVRLGIICYLIIIASSPMIHRFLQSIYMVIALYVLHLFTLYSVYAKYDAFEKLLTEYAFNTKTQQEYSKQEIQFLIARFAHGHDAFEKGIATNTKLLAELEKITQNIKTNSEIANKSKDLLEKIGTHISK